MKSTNFGCGDLSDPSEVSGETLKAPSLVANHDIDATTAQAENAINQYDVVAIGAGPQGLLYASWLKQERPQLRILILERSAAPTHKIGESTLSGFCKALRSVGIHHQAMQRLFFPKNGLGFFYGDNTITELTQAPEYILETFDETFQVERRVLDSLMIANARRLGVEVVQSAHFEPQKSSFGKAGNLLVYRQDGERHQVFARLVVDATGPASILGKHFGQYTTEGKPFQTSAVWAYFKDLRWLDSYPAWQAQAQFSRDEYTQHICFREGWMWYIPIVSWQQTSDENLARMMEQLTASEGELPSRKALMQEFDGSIAPIFSLGIALREDRDQLLKKGGEAVFEYYKQTVPLIAQLLDGAEILSGYYENHNPYVIRRQIRRHSEQVAGDGWILLGDAAFFVDPLISPGLTGGAATAYFAAQETLKALDNDDFSRSAFTGYEAFAHQLHGALERDNQLVYMSFNHPEALALIQRFQEIYARRHFNDNELQTYGIADINVWGILDPEYQKTQKAAVALMHEEEQRVGAEVPIEQQTAAHYERMVARLRQCLRPYVDEHVELTPYLIQNKIQNKRSDDAGSRMVEGAKNFGAVSSWPRRVASRHSLAG